FQQALGPDHPNTATCLSNLGLLHYRTHNLVQAEALLSRALIASRRNLELAAQAQSEQEQLALAQLLRQDLDGYLSVAPLAGQPPDAAYQHALAWKGAVFARQRWLRLARSAADPETARLVRDLQQTANALAALAFAVSDPQQLPARLRRLQELN